MKQPEWQRGGICGALSSTSQQLNIEPSEQRERSTKSKFTVFDVLCCFTIKFHGDVFHECFQLATTSVM